MRRVLAGLVASVMVFAGVIGFGADPAFAADVSKSITPNATPVTVATTVAGDNVRVKFQGLTGQVISVATSAGTFASNCDANLSLLKPDGVTVLAGPVCGGQAGSIANVTLPANGTYQAFVDPQGSAVGTVTIAVTSTAALRTITPNAPTLSLSVPAGGTVNLGFQGTANKYVAVKGIGNAACSSNFKVVKPDTTDLTGATCAINGAGTFVDQTTLPVSGVYQLRLVNTSGTAKTVKMQLWVNVNKTGAIVLDGPAVTTAKLAVGMNSSSTFTGTTGTIVTMNLTGSTIASYCVSLVRPNASILASQCFGAGSGFFSETTLDATGTWKVLVDPTGTATGLVTIELNSATAGSGTIVIDGPAKTATISVSGSTVEWTFAATLGQKIAMKLTASTITNGCVNFYRPDTSFLQGSCFGAGSAFFDPLTIDAAGTWKMVIDPNGSNTGSVTAALIATPDVTGTITLGAAKAVTTTKPGQVARYTFTGTLNQKVSTKVTGSTYPNGASIYYYRPDGSFRGSGPFGNGFTDPITLDAAGTWTVEVDPYLEDVGGLSLLVSTVTDLSGTITLGSAKAVTTTQPGQLARYTFTGAVGQKISTTVTASTYPNGASIYYYRPNGSYFGSGPFGNGFTDPLTLDAAGTWTVEVDPYQENVGSLSLRVRLTPDVTGTITLGAAKAVATTLPGQVARYTFAGALNQKVSTKVTGSTYPNGASVYYYRPDGSYFGGGLFGNGFADPLTLDVAGTWTVEVDPYVQDVGGLSLLVSTVTDLSGTITVGGATKAVSLTQAGQKARYTFSRNNAQTFKATLTGSTITSAAVNFYRPNGSYATGCNFSTGASTCGQFTADATGTWTVEVDPYTEYLGNVTLGLTAT